MPRTAKVGAISKAQNCKMGDPSGFVKLQLVAKYEKKIEGEPFGDLKKFKNEIFEQCHSAEKRGPFGIFGHPLCCKMLKQMKGGGPLVQSKKFQKQSHSAVVSSISSTKICFI